jgi:hypothetical protein
MRLGFFGGILAVLIVAALIVGLFLYHLGDRRHGGLRGGGRSRSRTCLSIQIPC